MDTTTKKALRKYNWKAIDQSNIELIVAECSKHGMKGIYDELIKLYKNVSASLNLPFSEVYEAIKERNSLFYCSLDRFQHDFMLYDDASKLRLPLSYLILPEVSCGTKVTECLKLFLSLSSDEKYNVIKELQPYASMAK